MGSLEKVFMSPVRMTDEPFFVRKSPDMERSIRRVMAKYGAAGLDESALLPSYRSLRRRRPLEDDQAIAVTTENGCYKIMLDVKDFSEGSVTVKAVGDNELIIEGTIEQKSSSSDATSKRSEQSSRKFEQRLMFEDLQVEGMTSSVSPDGVLTVLAPMKLKTSAAIEGKSSTSVHQVQQQQQQIQQEIQQQQQVQQQQQTQQQQQLQQEQLAQQEQLQRQEQLLRQQEMQLKQQQALLQQQQQQLQEQQQQETAKQSFLATTSTTQSTELGREHIVPIEVEGQITDNRQSQLGQSTNIQSSTQLTQQANNQSTGAVQTSDSTQQRSTTSDKRLINVPIGSSFFSNSLVPITPYGSFFKDSFFDTSRSHFQQAVDKVFRKIGSPGGISDPLNWYTTQRSSLLQDDHRAAIVTSDNNAYKIVLDVKNFEDGTVSIRAVGDSELLVEATMEKKTDTTTTKRRFRQRFVTPGPVVSEAVTSALSEDGVLTITAPKKEPVFQIKDMGSNTERGTSILSTADSIFDNTSVAPSTVTSPTPAPTPAPSDVSGPFEPVFSRSTNESVNSSFSSTQTQLQQQQESVQQQQRQQLQQQQQLLQQQQQQLQQQQQQLQQQCASMTQSTASVVGSDVSNQEKLVKINYIDQNQSEIDALSQKSAPTQFQLVGDVRDITDYSMKETVKQRKSSSNTKDTSSINKLVSYENPSIFEFPIIRRGPFYQDSFFSGVHDYFQSAVRQVLDRWVEVPSLLSNDSRTLAKTSDFGRFHKTFSNYRSILDDDIFDDFACYKSLRHLNVKEENQAATVQETQTDFKIVLDVHGFTEKDITIKATAHNELLVEGKVEDKSSGSYRSASFRRQFLLPGPIKLESVYSALSADDILTITVPKNKALSITHVPLNTE